LKNTVGLFYKLHPTEPVNTFLLDSLNTVQDNQRRLISITADGVIDDTEIDDFVCIQEELEKISISVEALQLWSEQMVANGTIDIEFNPAKSINCQARTVATMKGLMDAGLIEDAMKSPDDYLRIVYNQTQPQEEQISIFDFI